MPKRQLDGANNRAKRRRELGMTREVQQLRTDQSLDPSRGGARGFPFWFRQRVLAAAMHSSVPFAADINLVSRSTIYNWRTRILPYRMGGNHDRTRLVGYDLFLLIFANFVYPEGLTEGYAAFIARNGGSVYFNQDIDVRLQELEFTRKRASTEAYAAYSFRSQLRAQLFWSQPPPLGVVGVRMIRFIDVDETGWELSGCGSSYGRAPLGVRSRKLGHYSKTSDRINLFMGIEPGDPNLPAHVDGSVENPRRWMFVTVENCNAQTCSVLIDQMCADIEQNPVGPHDHQRVVLWDNLTVHNSPLVIQTLEGRASRGQFEFLHLNRPPYQPKWAPIEYVFNLISAELNRRVQRDWTPAILEQNIREIAAQVGRNGGIFRTFIYCGYRP